MSCCQSSWSMSEIEWHENDLQTYTSKNVKISLRYQCFFFFFRKLIYVFAVSLTLQKEQCEQLSWKHWRGIWCLKPLLSYTYRFSLDYHQCLLRMFIQRMLLWNGVICDNLKRLQTVWHAHFYSQRTVGYISTCIFYFYCSNEVI